jgi:LysM repeat protein
LEKVERLSGDVERLTQDNLALRNKISALSEELGRIREEVAKASNNSNVQGDITRLGEEIKNLDRQRIKDNELIAQKLKDLASMIREVPSTPAVRPPSRKPSTDETTSAAVGAHFEHKIESGDTLSTIVEAYNQELKKQGSRITMKQVMDANPGVNWNKLRIGQKIIIPAPGK